jgi:hypothetical protein
MPRNSNKGLNMDSSKSFLPHTFPDPGYAGFKVTVSDDRSIKVRQGDWLSKYSMAIYGDFDHIDKFWRKNGSVYVKVTDKDLIKTGEILYHPDPLPGEPSSSPGDGTSEPPLQASYIAEFFRWIKREFTSTEWAVDAFGMVDFTLLFFRAGRGTIGIKDVVPWLPRAAQPVTNWYAAYRGGSLYDKDKVVGGSISPVWFGNAGCVLQPFRPWRRGTAGSIFPDFSGRVVVIEAGSNIASFTDGRSVTAIIFGVALSPFTIQAVLDRVFRLGQRGVLESMFLKTPGAGVALVAGHSRDFPAVGLAAGWGTTTEAAEHP